MEAVAWQIDWGSKAAGLAEAFEDRGLPVPEHLDYPVILPGAGPLLDAFLDLATDRPIGFGAGQIPGAAIRDYARFHGIDDPDEFELLRSVVMACDAEWLKRQAKSGS